MAMPQLNPGFDHHDGLAALGLKESHVFDTLRAGEADRRSASPLEPPNSAGWRAYLGRARVFNERLLLDEGWSSRVYKNLPLTVNPDKTIGITISRGDNRTGVPGHVQPRTIRPAGQAKVDLAFHVAQPHALFTLPETDRPFQELGDDEYADLELWILLFRREQYRGMVRIHSELSRPVDRDGRGRIDTWDPRITLPPLELTDVIEYPEDGPDDYDVPVEEL